jgi:hypothetical protein
MTVVTGDVEGRGRASIANGSSTRLPSLSHEEDNEQRESEGETCERTSMCICARGLELNSGRPRMDCFVKLLFGRVEFRIPTISLEYELRW